MYCNTYFCSPADGHFSWFWFGAVINKTTKICVQVFHGYILLCLLINCQSIFQAVFTILQFNQQMMGVPVAPQLLHLVILFYFHTTVCLKDKGINCFSTVVKNQLVIYEGIYFRTLFYSLCDHQCFIVNLEAS